MGLISRVSSRTYRHSINMSSRRTDKRRRNESMNDENAENIENIEPNRSSSKTTTSTNNDVSIVATQARNALYTDPSTSTNTHYKGAIKKIVLKNFMTYSDVTYNPGLGLNVLCGPNGSGKSSISSAICLGLHGNPKLSGREKNLAKYIKSGEAECKIEISFYGKKENSPPIIIERTLTRDLSQNDKEAAKSSFRTKIKGEHVFKKSTAANIE